MRRSARGYFSRSPLSGGPGFDRITVMKITEFPEAFTAYYHTFPFDEMNRLKLDHTQRVVETARQIMRAESFPEELLPAGEAAAWLHDLGRFSQFTQYRTFNDARSVNHALLSCGEALRLGWLDDWTPEARNRVLQAVAFHNLRDLPPDLPRENALLAHLVRDADKLDIFTVLDEAIRTDYLASHPEVYLELPFTAPPSERVVQTILDGGTVSYSEVKSFADFILIQIAWCRDGLHFATSRKLALERNEIGIRREYLCRILPEAREMIGTCCAVVEQILKEEVYG